MKTACLAFVLAFLALPAVTGAEPQTLVTYASGGAPGCPLKSGKREYQSNTIRFGANAAYILGTSVRGPDGCVSTTTLHLDRGGKESEIPLQTPDAHSFRLIDFSPDGSRLLLSAEASFEFPDEQYRYIFIADMPLGSDSTIQWKNTWDLFGWKECDATVETQGYSADGKVVVLARPSVMYQPRRKNCVDDAGLFIVDLEKGSAAPAPDKLDLKRYVSVSRGETQTCAADPDLVAKCFVVHGRLSFWNGSPSTRIWVIGTKHMLGVSDEVLPDNVNQMTDGFDTQIYGDFRVCPFNELKPGAMQSVCVDSAKNLVAKPREQKKDPEK